VAGQVLELKLDRRTANRHGKDVPVADDVPSRVVPRNEFIGTEVSAEMDAPQPFTVNGVVDDRCPRRQPALDAGACVVVRLEQIPHGPHVRLRQRKILVRVDVALARIRHDAEVGRVGDRVGVNQHLALLAEVVRVAKPVVQDGDQAHGSRRRIHVAERSRFDEHGAVHQAITRIGDGKFDLVLVAREDAELGGEDVGEPVVTEFAQVSSALPHIVVVV